MYAERSRRNLTEAAHASRRAVELAPQLAEAHASRGGVLALHKKYQQAASAFERALELNPELKILFFEKGDINLNLKYNCRKKKTVVLGWISGAAMLVRSWLKGKRQIRLIQRSQA